MKSLTLVFLLGAVLFVGMASAVTRRNMNQGTQDGRISLFSYIFHYYDPQVNPDDLKVNISLLLRSFNVNEDRNVLETDVWISYEWNDKRLKWEGREREFGDASVIRVNPERVWKPDLSLYNSADSAHQMNCWNSKVMLHSNGDLSWINPCKLESYCNFTLKASPYSTQTCNLKFGSWTFDGNAMDLQLKNNEKKIDFTSLTAPPGWEIISTGARRNSQIYQCCPEPYIDVTFDLTLRRVAPRDQVHYKHLI